MSYFLYLASPYSLFPAGLHAAYVVACQTVGELLLNGIPTFSPIAHTHAVATYCKMPSDHEFWMRADAPMMEAASGLIVYRGEGWMESRGIRSEIRTFLAANKPVLNLEPGPISQTFLASARQVIGMKA